ncbi:MAG: HU family DNA-binding protein [Prevotella sp.]|nr:HU family DNA-binding protein [Prevotella sp.]
MAKLTIQDISKVLTEKSGLHPRQANKFATEIFSIILERLQEGEQVKVKGLGTFKVVPVEARESVNVRTGERIMIEGHDKVTFTPDSLMKELVNKPFSQFDTVILNDGVVFDDDETSEEKEELLNDEEENLPLEKRPLVDYVTDDEPDLNQETYLDSESSVSGESDEEDNTVIETPEEKPVVDESENADDTDAEDNAEDNADDIAEESADDDGAYYEDEETDNRSWVKWLLASVVVLALMAASAYGGYKYAMNQMKPVLLANEKQPVKTAVEQPKDTLKTVKDTVKVSEPMEASVPVKQAEPVEEVQPMVIGKLDKVAKTKTPEVAEDPYAAKDERVRLGAYRIVGTLNVVTVQPGQTFYSICKGNLGPDMECYVEVYNNFPRNPQIKVGQKIKIPKLELKKKRKR